MATFITKPFLSSKFSSCGIDDWLDLMGDFEKLIKLLNMVVLCDFTKMYPNKGFLRETHAEICCTKITWILKCNLKAN